MTKKLLFLAFVLGWPVSIFAQIDSVQNDKSFFALGADDVTRDQNLVQSMLNRKTSTATQTDQFVSDAPATVYVISKEQIENRGYENLLDILDDIPETEIQRLANPEFNQHISFRGVAGNEKFLILQDGIRISAPTGDTHAIGNNFSVAHAEQVEVIIGPASALYGVDAFSGIIQIISKKNQNIPLQIKTSYGNNNTTQNTLNFGKKIGDISFALSGTFYHSDEPNFPEFYNQEFSWYRDEYKPKGDVLISPFFQTAVNVSDTEEIRNFSMPTTSYFTNVHVGIKDLEITYNRHFDSYSTCVSSKPEYCVYDKTSRFAYFIETISARHRYRSRNLKWLFQSTFSFHTYQLDNTSAFVNTYTSYLPGYKMEFGKSKKFEERIQYSPSRKLNLTAGLSYEILDDLPLTGDLPKPLDFKEPADLQDQYYLGSNIRDKDGNDLSIQQDFFYLHYLNYGTYLQLQAAATTKLDITAGVRYDINTRYEQSLNPRLGIVWKPTELLSVKMLYGESFLSPSPRKSHSHFGSFFPILDNQGEITGLGSNFFHLANSALEPEKLRSFESSFRYVVNNNVVVNLNGFYTNVNNIINKFAQNTDIDQFKDVPIGFVETAINEGTATVYGGSARMDAVYNLANGMGLNLYAGYAFTAGNTDGGTLLYAAKHQLRTGMEVNHMRFSFSPRIIFRSTSQGLPGLGTEEEAKSPAYAIVNLFSRFIIFKKNKSQLSLFSKINNLFNKKYYNTYIGGAEGMPLTPQRPLNYTIGLRLKLL